MPVDRFFVEKLSKESSQVELKGGEHHHLSHVMRLKAGASVSLIDGAGHLAIATVIHLSKEKTTLEVNELIWEEPANFDVVVIQAIPRMSRLEVIVEKGTELGMTKLWLFPAARGERYEMTPKKLERLEGIAIAAVKQCGRLYLPEISVKAPLGPWLEGVLPLFYGDVEKNAPTLLSCWKGGRDFNMIIGPESGLTEEEVKLLLRYQAQGVKLHRNILRTETAPLAALSLVEQLVLSEV